MCERSARVGKKISTWLTNDRIFIGSLFAPDSADSNNDTSIFGGGVRGRGAAGA